MLPFLSMSFEVGNRPIADKPLYSTSASTVSEVRPHAKKDVGLTDTD